MPERFVVWGTPWLVRGLLLGGAALLAASGPALARALRARVTRTGAVLAVAVCAAALALRLRAPAERRVFFDEYEHLDAARHLRAQGAFAVALAEAPGLDALRAPVWPGAAHQLYAWLGPRWNAWASALTAPALWAAGTLAFGETAGLAAAALWAGSPLAQAYAGTVTLEATAALFAALGLALLWAARPRSGLWLLACAAHARPECALLLPLAWALPAPAPPAWCGALAALALVPLALIARLAAAAGVAGYTEGAGASARLLAAHLPRDLAFLLSPAGLCWTLTWPALLGLWKRRGERGPRALALASAALLLLYASRSTGDFSMPGSERYALLAGLPLTLLAGAAFAAAPPAAGLVGAALGAALVFSRPLPPVEPAFLAEQAALQAARATLPAGAVVIAFNPPSVVEETGRGAVSPYLLLEGAAMPAGTPFLLEDWWSRQRPADAARIKAWAQARYTLALLPGGGEDRFYALAPAKTFPGKGFSVTR